MSERGENKEVEQGQPEEMSQALSPLTVLPCPLPASHPAGEGEGAPGSVALLSKCVLPAAFLTPRRRG